MALNTTTEPTGGLVFKKRGQNDLKKVLVLGNDGSGKSTFAEKYCQENNLNAVVLDIEDTNYTDLPSLTEFDLSNDKAAYRYLKKVLSEIEQMEEVTTIIIDGIDTIIESFVSEANGLKAYSDRSKTFFKFIKDCLKTKKNLIFIGQSPVDLDWYKGDENPNKCIIRINAIVNEKYRCIKTPKVKNPKSEDDYEYTYEVLKYRTADGKTVVDDNPLREICLNIQRELEADGIKVTKSTMKSKVVKDIKAGFIVESLRPDLIKYIQKHCPEELN
ncbi:MAG: AAA family ATPase [Methanobrevibacter sp.]|nr:AAA family ATPase [Methanobrevibacter sp.]MBR1748904.1 AAA family ATPase [Bacilli bacterium]